MFVNTYCGIEFNGLLGRQYPERHDRFQQLVGCYFQELYRLRAHVAPTLARDGSIDVFVEPPEDGAASWDGVPFPFVVECKDHDDESANLAANIEQGWSAVKEKLRKQADAGWLGHYAPWLRTKGYVYCVSPNLNQAQRDKLLSSIRVFFDSLPSEKKPPIETVKVLCWSDVAALLNRHPRLADAWLGVRFPSIVGHEEYLDGLMHFRGYLKEENLPFVSPNLHCPSHPERILSSLEATEGKPGLLLVGPGGVGKTRTCLETARLAHKRGWRVLHYKPTDTQIDLNELGNFLIQETGKTLLVIDYIDQLGLSFVSLRREILDLARQRGMHLALLANARPGFLFEEDDHRDALFEQISLEIASRQEAIIDNVARSVAPNACDRIGASQVSAICGKRPIIAMFIARELERMADAGALDNESLIRLREADLSEWLRRRLREDGLIQKGRRGALMPPSPEPQMLASVACLAATPMSAEELKQVMRVTLDACDHSNPEGVAEGLLHSLMTLGWLEEEGRDHTSRLQSPHDVVTDELLENALFSRGQGNIRGECFQRVLAAAAAMPRAWGRFAVALDRLLGQWSAGSAKSAVLVKAAGDWFATHKNALARVFSTADIDETAYALGAVITSHAWYEILLAHWGEIVLPWLRASIVSPASRHLLHRSLKTLKGQGAQEALALALAWLTNHRLSLYASFVLAPLLSRDDLGEKAQEAIAAALTWLEDHFLSQDAEFVVKHLLGNPTLSTEKREHCAQLALKRAETVLQSPEASFILKSCLQERSLSQTTRDMIIHLALQWLAMFRGKENTDFVFNKLLRDRKVLDDHWVQTASHALAFLSCQPLRASSEFSLNSLCCRPNLLDEPSKNVIHEQGTRWLKTYPDNTGCERLRNNLGRLRHNPDDISEGFPLSAALSQCLEEGRMPEQALLQQGLAKAHERLEQNMAASAGYYLSSLLPLSCRLNDRENIKQAMLACKAFLDAMACDPRPIHGFLNSLEKSLEQGLWPNQEQGQKLLDILCAKMKL